MRTTHWIIGFAFFIAAIGSAAGTSLDAQDMDNAPRSANDMNGARDVSGSGGDALGLNRETPASPGSGSTSGTSGNTSEHFGGGTLLPIQPRRSHLGWQSLLPGSIQ